MCVVQQTHSCMLCNKHAQEEDRLLMGEEKGEEDKAAHAHSAGELHGTHAQRMKTLTQALPLAPMHTLCKQEDVHKSLLVLAPCRRG